MSSPFVLLLLGLAALVSGVFHRCQGDCRCNAGYEIITCPGTNLTGLPTVFALEVTVKTKVLGLQRNRIEQLSVSELDRRFPRLQVLDLREQKAPFVRLLGGQLADNLTVYGKQPISFPASLFRQIFCRLTICIPTLLR